MSVHRMAQSTCPICAKPFTLRAYLLKSGVRRFCSRTCTAKAGLEAIAAKMAAQPSPSPETLKRRAHGLIDMRIRRGLIVRPTACSKCGKPGKVDGHHKDYSRPQDVTWYCRRCHMEAHRIPA